MVRQQPAPATSATDLFFVAFCNTGHRPTVLGSGSFGRVERRLARCVEAGKYVYRAVKFILELAPGAVRREVQALETLKHPHIVPLLAEFPPVPEGTSKRREHVLVFPERESNLRHFLGRRDSPVPGAVVHTWACQLVSAISYMHEHGFIHRDLKPSNILMKWDSSQLAIEGPQRDSSRGAIAGQQRDSCLCASAGLPLALEIADFGTARQVSVKRRRCSTKTSANGAEAIHRRVPGMTPGVCTFPYAAPEMWCSGFHNETTTYGLGAGVWAYGTVAFELLTHEQFVAGESDAARVASVWARLGPCPDAVFLGPRQEALVVAAKRRRESGEGPYPAALSTFGAPLPDNLWGHVALCLTWDPVKRATAKTLS